jgi:S-(hydroxymethyl)glutathione dehydrogenase / alcohol dehydrogenase
MNMIRAAICRSFGQPLTVEPVKLARPGAEDVRVRIKACAICHSDISYARGDWQCDLPAVFGHEAAGIVVETGSAVTACRPGDRAIVTLIRSCGTCHHCRDSSAVLCEATFDLDRNGPISLVDGSGVHQAMRTGAFSEEAVVHQSQLSPLPADLPFDAASLLACGVITGYGAVFNTARLRAGQSAVVIGCGGVGLNAIQAAALAEANPLVAVDLSAVKRKAAIAFGAQEALDPRTDDIPEAVRHLTEGRGADFVFVTVGSVDAINVAQALLARRGTIVIVGMPPSGVSASYDPSTLAAMNQRIVGSKMGDTSLERDIPKIINAWREGRFMLEPLITGRFRLEQINEAIEGVITGDALRNVIMFD